MFKGHMFEIGSLNVLNGYLNILRTNLDFIYTVEIFKPGTTYIQNNFKTRKIG